MEPSKLRSRHAPATETQAPPPPSTSDPPPRRRSLHILDVLRVLGGVCLLSGTLSYLVTGHKSFSWNYSLRPERLKAWIVRFAPPPILVSPIPRLRAWARPALKANAPKPQRGPLQLTPSQLLLHDGRSYPELPIYLALNASIYDVSASPHLYGPGGSYHFFAGRDATRAFVTGCFDQDLTGDLRGVERMFIPVDEDVGEEAGGEGENSKEKRRARKLRRERDVREAKRKVWEAVDGWRKMFEEGKGGKYFRVGKVVGREEGWGEEIPRLCDKAEKARPKRGVEG